MNDGLYTKESTLNITDENNEEFQYDITFSAYEDEEGYTAFPNQPDLANEVLETDKTQKFRSSDYLNRLGQLQASWFTLDREYQDDGYRFRLNDEYIDLIKFHAFSYMADPDYLDNLSDYYLYTDGEDITALSYRYSTTENEAISGETYFSILDVGTTQLTLEDITFEPFSHEESENKYYDSFTTAVNKLNEHNYSYSITCVDEDNRPVQKSKSCITSDGWSGMDEAITYTTDASFSENIYFGTHKNEDQTIDYYYGQAPDELSNVSHIRDIYYSITNFSFSPEIWDFNLSESTEEEYHFTLSDEIVNIYKTRVITSLMTNDVFSQQALDISRPHLVINSDGTIKWFDFVYENYDETFTLTQNFYDYGTTEIPPSIADFTNHVPYPRT